MSGLVVAGTPNYLEQTRFQNIVTATCTNGLCALVGCFFNCMLGTRKTTPISSTQTRRLLDTVSCCGSRSTTLTPQWSELAGWGRRSSKNLTSTLPRDTGRSGSAIPMAMWWWWPVRTVNAVAKPPRGRATEAVEDRRAASGPGRPRSSEASPDVRVLVVTGWSTLLSHNNQDARLLAWLWLDMTRWEAVAHIPRTATRVREHGARLLHFCLSLCREDEQASREAQQCRKNRRTHGSKDYQPASQIERPAGVSGGLSPANNPRWPWRWAHGRPTPLVGSAVARDSEVSLAWHGV